MKKKTVNIFRFLCFLNVFNHIFNIFMQVQDLKIFFMIKKNNERLQLSQKEYTQIKVDTFKMT